MNRIAFRVLLALALVAPGVARASRGALAPGESITPGECARLLELQIDKQAGPRASRLAATCGGRGVGTSPAVVPLAGAGARSTPDALGGSDLNLITGTETFPAVTQGGSMVWGNGSEVVAVFNDTRDAPTSFSGLSVSTDGGANFERLDPNPFAAVFAGDAGSPAIARDDLGATWVALTLAATCGGQGIGVMTSATPGDSASWTGQPCAHSGAADDRPILWIDNNPSSPFHGRRYVAFNDFAASGALKILHFSGGVWNEVTVTASFVRNVHLTGSPGPDGTVFIFGMNEGGGAGSSRSNVVYRSTDGGVTWTTFLPGPGYPAVGAGLCAASDYFYMVPPVWRTMGWGQGAVGPNGVVHYVWARAGQVPGDLGDIYYIRSSDNGASWSSPMPLNTDQAAQNNVVQWLPSISVTAQGYVLATWYDRRNTTDGLEYEIYGRLSLDNGATWLPDEALSDVHIPQPTQVDPALDFCFAGDSNLHSALGNASLVTWTDGRNALEGQQQMDVYFRKVPLCPTIEVAPAALPRGVVSQAYSTTLSASGGDGPYTFLTSGVAPPGLQFDGTTGELTGTPTTAGIFVFSVVAIDAFGCAGNLTFHVIIDPPACPTFTLTPPTLPGATQGAPYSQILTPSGGTAPFSWTVTAGAPPQGLALDPVTGELAGVPVESGTYAFDVTASGADLCTGTLGYSLQVGCPTITLLPIGRQLPDAFAGLPYLTNITANGGTAPYTFEIIQGTTHDGIYFGEGGTVFGVTEGPGTKIFNVRAVDANGCSGEAQFRMDSQNCFDGAILCDAMGDILVNFTPADLCNGNAEWHGTGACPSSDDIGHTPSAHARWGTLGDCFDYGAGSTQDSLDSVAVDVSNCNSGEVLLRFNYLLGLEDDASLDRARVEVVADGGAPQVVADNGAGGPTCAGAASPGLGNLRNWSGWQHLDLTVPATSTFQVRFVGETDDGTANSGEGFLVDDVNIQCVCPEDYVVLPEALPHGTVNNFYSVTIGGDGGAPPYTFETLPGNPPPAGLSLDPLTGVLSGVPTSAGIFPFAVVVVDSNFCKAIIFYNLLISPENCPAITFAPPILPDAFQGVFYSAVVTASGGVEPYAYQVTSGQLPDGLALDPTTGAISGTPTTSDVFSFTISAIDDEFCVASQSYTIIVMPEGCPAITILPSVLPNPTRGVPYSQFFAAEGGVGPYEWFVTQGALPAGLLLDPASGQLFGSALVSGSFAFAVTAQDSTLCAGTQAMTLQVEETMPFIDGFESGDTSAWSATLP